jgi:hypothetical protein
VMGAAAFCDGSWSSGWSAAANRMGVADARGLPSYRHCYLPQQVRQHGTEVMQATIRCLDCRVSCPVEPRARSVCEKQMRWLAEPRSPVVAERVVCKVLRDPIHNF